LRILVKSLFFIWASVSLLSLCGLVYAFPGYSVDSAFSQALRKQPSLEASFWFHWAVIFLLVGVCMTSWLYFVYRKQYGRLWKTN